MKFVCRWFFPLFFISWSIIASANPLLDQITQGNTLQQQQQILPPEEAFHVHAELIDEDTLHIYWEVADNIYLYADQFVFTPHHMVIGQAQFPESVPKSDDFLGDYEVYYSPLTVEIPILARDSDQASLDIRYQGCSESGYCYPPLAETITIHFQDGTEVTTGDLQMGIQQDAPIEFQQAEQDRITQLLDDASTWWVLLAFIGFGLLLTFTPCVLPMIPILSAVILGKGEATGKMRALVLSIGYVFGMAVTYAIAGVLAAMAGGTIQAALQKPWVIALFSGLFIVLALSMFGAFELRLPNWLESRVGAANRRLKGGHIYSATLMGALSALVVSPCITPPLVGALVYIGQSGDLLLGGSALFSLGIGMGIPLIIVATFGIGSLPTTGQWMNTVKNVFGVLLLGVAIWLLERIIPGPITLFLWGSLLFISPIYLGVTATPTTPLQHLSKGIGYLSIFIGCLLVIGALMGNSNLFKPLANVTLANHVNQTTTSNSLSHIKVKSLADVERHLAAAKAEGKPVLLDFYADWCASCIIMQNTTFTDALVLELLDQFIVLQADVTAYDSTDRELQQAFGVFAPPAFIFFTPDGKELASARTVGEVTPQAMQQHLTEILRHSHIIKEEA